MKRAQEFTELWTEVREIGGQAYPRPQRLVRRRVGHVAEGLGPARIRFAAVSGEPRPKKLKVLAKEAGLRDGRHEAVLGQTLKYYTNMFEVVRLIFAEDDYIIKVRDAEGGRAAEDFMHRGLYFGGGRLQSETDASPLDKATVWQCHCRQWSVFWVDVELLVHTGQVQFAENLPDSQHIDQAVDEWYRGCITFCHCIDAPQVDDHAQAAVAFLYKEHW